MPIYTFNCVECEKQSDRIVKIAERDDQHCEECDAKLVRGIDSPGAVWAPSSSSGGLRV